MDEHRDGRVRAAVRELSRAVVPVACPGCGALDVVLCPGCRALLERAPWRCESLAPRLDRPTDAAAVPVWALASYEGPARSAVVAWKSRGRLDLGAPFGAAMRTGAARLARSWEDGLVAAGWTDGDPVLVVPAPSSRAATRRRGADLVAGLAREVARGLREAGLPARAEVLLRRGRGPGQAGLGLRSRARNRMGTVVLRGGPPRSRLRPVVLVDDVLTTGATVATCVDTLDVAGLPVIGTFVLASAPAPVAPSG